MIYVHITNHRRRRRYRHRHSISSHSQNEQWTMFELNKRTLKLMQACVVSIKPAHWLCAALKMHQNYSCFQFLSPQWVKLTSKNRPICSNRFITNILFAIIFCLFELIDTFQTLLKTRIQVDFLLSNDQYRNKILSSSE